MTVMPTAARAARQPVAALLFNAMVWGLTWWPMRLLQARGLHPLWATAVIFALAVIAIGLWKPRAWRAVAAHPPLWGILLAAGTTNACFNWGVTAGDVVRVVLLFYLMPLWTVVLARWLLNEPVTRAALLRVGLALAGAALVLWPQDAKQVLAVQPIDLLGLAGGFSFALNNILLRREAQRSDPAGRGLAMFLGGCLVSLALTQVLTVPALPPLAAGWLPGALALALLYLASNLALQHGASRLPANVTSVIMLTEVLWAAGSAWALGAGTMSLPLLVGGALIVAGAALAALKP